MGHCSEDAAWSEPQTAAQPAVLSFEALGWNGSEQGLTALGLNCAAAVH